LAQSFKGDIKTELEALTPAAKIIFEGCTDPEIKKWATEVFEKAKSA
jgi:hypothetical protein